MLDNPERAVDSIRRFIFIREETRFEIGLLHDRINALISAEAFLTIAYTMAMGNAGSTFARFVAPALSLVGLVLAVLAWPGVDASFKIILEWNTRQLQVMLEDPLLVDTMWRLPVLGRRHPHTDPDQRMTMLFARAVPVVFGIAWAVLTGVAIALPFH